MKLVNIHKQKVLALLFVVALNVAQAQVWTLHQCIDSAQVYNKTLQMQRNNVAIGEQREKEAKANLMPKVMANADYRYFTDLPYQLLPLNALNPIAPEGEFRAAQFGVPHNINANIQLSIPLYNPQIHGAIKNTKIASKVSELQYKKSQEQIFFEISNLYYNAQILHHQLAFIDSNKNNTEQLAKIVQLRHEQLLAKGTDVSKVKLQLTQLSTQRATISSTYNQVLNALKFAIGIPIEQRFEINTDIRYQSIDEYTSSSTIDIGLIKSQNCLLVSELNTLNKTKYLPSIGLFAMYGRTGYGYSSAANSFLDFYPIGFGGIQMSLPLFNGTVTQRKINQKLFEIRNNELQLELMDEQIIMQIESAKLQSEVGEETIETTTAQIKLAQIIYEQTLLQHKQGTLNLTDVLMADNALREVQQTYLNAVINYLKSELELKKLTGNISTFK